MTTLTDVEVRVLGSLIEKELTTPQYYPLTLNALINACNQKSNRNPVVNFDESEVVQALDGLRRNGLAGETSGAGSRVVKYRHVMPSAMELGGAEVAVLSELMLRGPQTAGELRSRAGRMHEFESLEEVSAILDRLQHREPALVALLPRRPGQKESRYMHLLAGEPDESELPPADAGDMPAPEHLALIRQELDQLRQDFEALREDFIAWKKEFE